MLLALIAPGWLETKAPGGGRRIDSDDDFVRQEIGTALQLGRKVIPVLFDDTPMPEAAQLPDPLRKLSTCDALTLRGKNFEYDVQLEELVRLIAALPGMPAPLPPSEGVIVGQGLEFDVYRGTRYIPIRLRAPLRDAFKPLIEDRTRIFAGRRQVFETIMQFAAREKGGYLVITAPPGFGKTALIANLVSATPEAFAYHFFAPIYGEETLDEKFFLQNVLQQMAAWHSYAVELPDAINELRAIYQQFVDTPLEHSQVLVLDGLDEVSNWKLAPYLGRKLPNHLHIIVTIRDVGQDWLSEYGFPADQVESLQLAGLERTEIRELFARLGPAGIQIAGDNALMDHIIERAAYEDDLGLGADPFYVRFLAEDVANASVAPHEIPDQPKGLEAYLDRWWKQIVQLAGDAPVRDLFGTLAAAVGPIARTDLEAINKTLRDDWVGDFFDQVLARVRRIVRQDKDGRYSLAHPRLRRYVANPKRIGKINHYVDQLLDYCSSWTEHRSPYALAFYATHLSEAGRVDDLYELFSAEWIAAHWSVLRTYGPLVADFDRVGRALQAAQSPDVPRMLALVVARQTGRQLMLDFPDELFVAWASHGEVERCLACLALGTKESTSDSLAVVARELLDLHEKKADDYDDRAAELLIQLADQLPRQFSASQQFKALSTLAELLPYEHGLPETTRLELIRQAIDFVDGSDDDVLRAGGLAALASALCSSTPDLDVARDLFDRASAALESIDLTADRAFVLTSLLPGMQAFAPDEELLELEKLVEQGASLLEHGSLKKNPCIRLLERWRPWDSKQRDRATSVLLKISKLYLDESAADYAGAALALIVPHLCRLGQVNAALGLVDRCQQMDPVAGAQIVIRGFDGLREFAPDRVADWLESAKKLTDPSFHDIHINRELFTASVVKALATVGDWDGALEFAETLGASVRVDALVDLLRLAGATLSLDAVARGAIMNRIIRVANEFNDYDSSDRARISAVAAQVLGSTAGGQADVEMAHATAVCLADLPQGSTEILRRLYAVALHEDGATDDVVAILQQTSSVANVASTLAFLATSSTSDAVQRDTYIKALLDELSEREGATFYSDALGEVAPAVVQLAREAAPLASTLAGYIFGQIEKLYLEDGIRIYATLIAGICYVDADHGAQLYGSLLDGIGAMRSKGQQITAATIAGVFTDLASAAIPIGDRLTPLALKAETLANEFKEGEEAITIHGAVCLITAQRDCNAAREGLEQLVPTIAALAEAPPPARYLARMVADMFGRRAGDNEPQAKAAASLAEAVVRCAHHCPAEAAQVLQQVIDQTLAIRSDDDRAQALIDIFEKLKSGPAEWSPLIEVSLSSALKRAQLSDASLNGAIFAAAVDAMCAADDHDAAERLAHQAADPSVLEYLLEQINSDRERLAIGELSTFERAFVGIGDGKLAYAVLHSIKQENGSEELLAFFGDTLVFQQGGTERQRLLSEFLPQCTAPLKTLHGTKEIGRLISEVERFDHAFKEAAQIIGQGG